MKPRPARAARCSFERASNGPQAERRLWLAFRAVGMLAAFISAVLAAACSGQPIPQPTPPQGVQTAGEAASRGQGIFAANCAGCHGDRGQGGIGPVVIGAGSSLGKFNTARRLLDYISTAMPKNRPGRLAQPEYQQVLAYLLAQNGYVTSSEVFDTNGLDRITVTR